MIYYILFLYANINKTTMSVVEKLLFIKTILSLEYGMILVGNFYQNVKTQYHA